MDTAQTDVKVRAAPQKMILEKQGRVVRIGRQPSLDGVKDRIDPLPLWETRPYYVIEALTAILIMLFAPSAAQRA
jgi:hypothetical protein